MDQRHIQPDLETETRQPWRTPVLRRIDGRDAENDAGNGTDSNGRLS